VLKPIARLGPPVWFLPQVSASPPACRVSEPCFVSPRSTIADAFDKSGNLIPASLPRLKQGPMGPMPEDSSGLTADDKFVLALKAMPDAGFGYAWPPCP
jgi:hypothetical protein